MSGLQIPTAEWSFWRTFCKLLNNQLAHVAWRIAFHKPLNADFQKYALVQSFRYDGSCAWAVDTEVKGFSGIETESELPPTGVTCDNKNNSRIIRKWPDPDLNEQDNGEGCEEINALRAYKLRINKTNTSKPCRWRRCWWTTSAPAAQKIHHVPFA